MRPAACLCAIAVTLTVSANAATAKPPLEFNVDRLLGEARALMVERARLLSTAGRTPLSCGSAMTSCPLTVAVAATRLTINGSPYIVCSAITDDLEHPDAELGKPKKEIVWSIQSAWYQPDGSPWVGQPPAGDFGFYNAPGIVLIKNPDTQIELPPLATSPGITQEFRASNKLTKKDRTAVYLPVILFLKSSGASLDFDNPTLCGAVDPKIINTP